MVNGLACHACAAQRQWHRKQMTQQNYRQLVLNVSLHYLMVPSADSKAWLRGCIWYGLLVFASLQHVPVVQLLYSLGKLPHGLQLLLLGHSPAV